MSQASGERTGQHRRPLGVAGSRAVPGSGSGEEARLINERFRGRSGPEAGGECVFVCECGWEGCDRGVLLTIAEYDAVRANPGWFALLPGHERGSDMIVHRTERHLIVSKPSPRGSRSGRGSRGSRNERIPGSGRVEAGS